MGGVESNGYANSIVNGDPSLYLTIPATYTRTLKYRCTVTAHNMVSNALTINEPKKIIKTSENGNTINLDILTNSTGSIKVMNLFTGDITVSDGLVLTNLVDKSKSSGYNELGIPSNSVRGIYKYTITPSEAGGKLTTSHDNVDNDSIILKINIKNSGDTLPTGTNTYNNWGNIIFGQDYTFTNGNLLTGFSPQGSFNCKRSYGRW